MRKILFFVMFLLVVAMNTSFANDMVVVNQQNTMPSVMSMVGKVKEVSGRSVLIEVIDKKMGMVRANTSDSTYVYDTEKNEFISIADLKVGKKVTLYHSPAMTRSLPPQTAAFAIVLGKDENAARYYRVDEVYPDVKGSRFLTQSKGLIVSSKLDKDLKAKDELLVWHGPVALSMPGQTNASKVINLSNMKKGKITIHLNAGILAVNGKEIQVTLDKPKGDAYKIVKKGNTYLVPLMPIAKALELKINYEEAKGMVIVDDGGEFALLSLDNRICNFDGERIELSNAPKTVNGVILVPLDFFKNVLNVNFELINTAI